MRVLAALLLLAASVAASAAGIEGTWRGEADGEPLVLVFGAGGSGTLNGEPIRYKLLGQQLLVEQGGEITAYGVTLQDARMSVTGGTLAQPLLLQRESAKPASRDRTPAPSAASGVRTELAGRWCRVAGFTANAGGGSQSSHCFDLGTDGRYRYDGENSASAYSHGSHGLYGGTVSSSQDSGRWSADRGTLTAHSDSGRVQRYALTLKNHPKNRDPMICLDGECYVTHFQKAPW